MTDSAPHAVAQHTPLSNEYDYEEENSFEDQLIAFRNRSNKRNVVDYKEGVLEIATDFHQYSLNGTGNEKGGAPANPAAYRAGVPLDVPYCIRHTKDVQDIFSPQSIHSIIQDSRKRAEMIVRSHYQVDETSAFGGSAQDGDNPRVGVPHDYSLETALAAVRRPDRDPLSVMIDVRDRLSKALCERGRVPTIESVRKRIVDNLADARVHSACHSDRLMTKELMLHSTNIPERFAFGALRDARRTSSRRFLRGASDEQRVRIQNRWDDSANHHLVRAVQRYSQSEPESKSRV